MTMDRVVLCRYGEIGLKGGNRAVFERKLAANIRACLEAHGISVGRIERPYGRIVVHTEGPADCLRAVFGITSFSPAVIANDLDEAKRLAPTVFAPAQGKTFRVTCQRLDKQYPLVSRDVAKALGLAVTEATGAEAALTGYDREFEVEVIQGKLYLCATRITGPGGLPLGIEGTVAARIRSERDVLAALLIMRRGCDVAPLVEGDADVDLLERYACGRPLRARDVIGLPVVSGDAEPAPPGPVLHLRPLAGVPDEEIEERLHGFRTAVVHG